MSNSANSTLKVQESADNKLTSDEAFQREKVKFEEISKLLETCYFCINLRVKGFLTESEFERCRNDAIAKIKSLTYV